VHVPIVPLWIMTMRMTTATTVTTHTNMTRTTVRFSQLGCEPALLILKSRLGADDDDDDDDDDDYQHMLLTQQMMLMISAPAFSVHCSISLFPHPEEEKPRHSSKQTQLPLSSHHSHHSSSSSSV
jgi:hypothetical protein